MASELVNRLIRMTNFIIKSELMAELTQGAREFGCLRALWDAQISWMGGDRSFQRGFPSVLDHTGPDAPRISNFNFSIQSPISQHPVDYAICLK